MKQDYDRALVERTVRQFGVGMNLEEYKEKVHNIEKQAELYKYQAAKEYALSNNTIAVGDVIKDHIGNVMVKKIMIYRSNPPQCAYEGIECKKDGIINKRGKTRTVFQSNMMPGKLNNITVL